MPFDHRHFNPRSREGSDVWMLMLRTRDLVFQSTLPRRERRGTATAESASKYFNPRSREGSDHIGINLLILSWTFQSTLPRRERLNTSYLLCRAAGFQSTLPRRERHQYLLFIMPCRGISIHAPAKGATRQMIMVTLTVPFQSTLPRRERQQKSPRPFPMIFAK